VDKVGLVDVFVRVSFPERCSSCGEAFRSDEEHLGVVEASGVEAGTVVEALDRLWRARAYHLRHAPPPGTPGRVLGASERPLRGVSPRYGPAHFALVSQVYREAVAGGSATPTRAVAATFSISRSTAAKWVARARGLGLLAATSRGVVAV
jgi:hypothetical protein